MIAWMFPRASSRIFVNARPTFAQGFEAVFKTMDFRIIAQIPKCLDLALLWEGGFMRYQKRGCVVMCQLPARHEFAVDGTFDFGKQPWRKCIKKADRTEEQARVIKSLPTGKVACTWIVKSPVNTRPTLVLQL
jgi:hypothetical protein